MTDIYKAPEAKLRDAAVVQNFGSVEKGIAGDYEFSVGAAIREAWSLTPGTKWTVQLALMLYLLVYIFIVAGTAGISHVLTSQGADKGTLIAVKLVMQLVSMALAMPLGAGLFILGLRRVVGGEIRPGLVLSCYDKTWQLFLTTVLMYVMILVGFILLVIPGIYLMVSYMMAMPLVVDKNLGPWQALEASRKAISNRWFAMFGLWWTIFLLILLCVITLGIAFIWVAPVMLYSWGIVYRNMFGCETATLER